MTGGKAQSKTVYGDSPRGEEYANPDVPHEVNVSEKRPLADFVRLTLGACLLIGAVVGGVFYSARWWASAIPFRHETLLTEKLGLDDRQTPPCALMGEAALQHLANELSARMNLPEGMRIHAHFSGDDDPNALATLGGHIFIQRGLLKAVSSENALAMVIAHEIAHIKRRDPVVSLGGGVAVALLLSAALGGSDGGALVGWMVGMTQMSFSRAQEAAADAEALAALKSYYGYTNGADEFFLYITQTYPKTAGIPAFVSTHPAPDARIAEIQKSFTSAGAASGVISGIAPGVPKLTPLPSEIRALTVCYSVPAAGI